jgi:hypothetical protein
MTHRLSQQWLEGRQRCLDKLEESKYQKFYPATIIYHDPYDQEQINQLLSEKNELICNNEKLEVKLKKTEEAEKIRYEQLKKKYLTLSNLYSEVLKRLNDIQLYAPEFGTEYAQAKEEFERIQKMST